jgi:hypothetical protein
MIKDLRNYMFNNKLVETAKKKVVQLRKPARCLQIQKQQMKIREEEL